MSDKLDIKPTPRVLAMLGEITFAQWQCFAELIDNSIDAFIADKQSGGKIDNPQIFINFPTSRVSRNQARITYRDNANGMSLEQLQNAVRAGWTSNSPLDNLGLFGMGFNIATARLGNITTVWTTRCGDPEWTGIEIDFGKMQQDGEFTAPKLTRPKTNKNESGTEVEISSLKQEQLNWFAQPSSYSVIQKRIERIYGSMLRENPYPIGVKIKLNNTTCNPHRFCVWGDPLNSEPRVKETKEGPVSAFQEFDFTLPEKKFCHSCWIWVGDDLDSCPQCGKDDKLKPAKRRIKGWVGLQRYLDKEKYGFDLIRNGRKIEIDCKDLFYFVGIDGEGNELKELEYPYDDVRGRGRIVGEIHVDHCKVSYTKDRFVRNDTMWSEMVNIVRGEAPFRARRCTELGYAPNESVLARFWRAFQRPVTNKNPKFYQTQFVLQNNVVAATWGKYFEDGNSDYISDERWYAQALIDDNEKLTGGGNSKGGGPDDPGLSGFGANDQSGGQQGGKGPDQNENVTEEQPELKKIPVRELSAEFYVEDVKHTFNVQAFELESKVPGKEEPDLPWTLSARPDGVHEFCFKPRHPIYDNLTFSPKDALLTEIAFLAKDISRHSAVTFSQILSRLRKRYAHETSIAVSDLRVSADQLIVRIIEKFRERKGSVNFVEEYERLNESTKKSIQLTAMKAGAKNIPNLSKTGEYLAYCPKPQLHDVIGQIPTAFMDGEVFDLAYSQLEMSESGGSDSEVLEIQEITLNSVTNTLREIIDICYSDSFSLNEIQSEDRKRVYLGIMKLKGLI
jgi:hypothetical protein